MAPRCRGGSTGPRPWRSDSSFHDGGRRGLRIPDRVTLLADVAEIVSRSHDLDETLSNVVDLVAKRLDTDVCSLYLAGSDMSRLRLSATVGLHKDAVGQVELGVHEGLVGLAAERLEPVVIERAREHPRYKYFPETGEERFESLMAAPLMFRGIALGVLAVQTRELRHFDRGDLNTLQTCAQLIAPVVLNAQLLQSVDETDEERARADAELARSGIPMAQQEQVSRARSVELRGLATSRGVAIGPVFKLSAPTDLEQLDYTPSEDADQE